MQTGFLYRDLPFDTSRNRREQNKLDKTKCQFIHFSCGGAKDQSHVFAPKSVTTTCLSLNKTIDVAAPCGSEAKGKKNNEPQYPYPWGEIPHPPKG